MPARSAKSVITEHTWNEGNRIDWSGVTVLDMALRDTSRRHYASLGLQPTDASITMRDTNYQDAGLPQQRK